MGNQILTKLTRGMGTGQNNLLNNIVALSRDFRNAQNPQEFVQNMMAKDPRVQEAMRYMQGFQSPREAYYNLARQKGVDPDEFLKNFN